MATINAEREESAPRSCPADQPSRLEHVYQTGNWTTRLWIGCDFFTWLRRLRHNGYDVDRRFWPAMPLLTFMSSEFTFLRNTQRRIYGRRIERTAIDKPPIFILGHWRSGTTLLHELLTRDDRFGYATTYQCLAPLHFLLTERIAMRAFSRFVPRQRPMDHMRLGWDRPQEDEFALVAMGLGSPYMTIAFPNRAEQDREYLALEDVPQAELARWKDTYLRFLKSVTYRCGKRLVLKSPTHTWRIKVLLDMFPDARFVHIVRNPLDVFPSTMHLWKTLYSLNGLQKPTFADLGERVLSTFVDMHDQLDRTRNLIPAGRFCELRYEDLVTEPVQQMNRIYDQLRLEGFDRVRPAIRSYLGEVRDYRPNAYFLTDEERSRVSERWGAIGAHYGYDLDARVVPSRH